MGRIFISYACGDAKPGYSDNKDYIHFFDAFYKRLDDELRDRGLNGYDIYLDEKNLAVGDNVSEIIKAVSNSLLFIPFYSLKSRISKWCNDELETFKKTLGPEYALAQRILPICLDRECEDDLKKLWGGIIYSSDFMLPDNDRGWHGRFRPCHQFHQAVADFSKIVYDQYVLAEKSIQDPEPNNETEEAPQSLLVEYQKYLGKLSRLFPDSGHISEPYNNLIQEIEFQILHDRILDYVRSIDSGKNVGDGRYDTCRGLLVEVARQASEFLESAGTREQLQKAGLNLKNFGSFVGGLLVLVVDPAWVRDNRDKLNREYIQNIFGRETFDLGWRGLVEGPLKILNCAVTLGLLKLEYLFDQRPGDPTDSRKINYQHDRRIRRDAVLDEEIVQDIQQKQFKKIARQVLSDSRRLMKLEEKDGKLTDAEREKLIDDVRAILKTAANDGHHFSFLIKLQNRDDCNLEELVRILKADAGLGLKSLSVIVQDDSSTDSIEAVVQILGYAKSCYDELMQRGS